MSTENPQQLLILVGGPPASGKTTIGRRIATHLGVPFVGRDAIKELLFDSLGWQDRAWSQRLGGASWELLFYVAELLLQGGQTFVLESNFDPAYHLSRLRAWQARYGFTPVQVQCHAEPDTLYQRFHQRAVSGERHPGHVDHLASRAEFIANHLPRNNAPMALEGPVIEIDSTDFESIDYPLLFQKIMPASA